MERVSFISFLCYSRKELEIIVITPLLRIISDQVMEVEAMNLTAWYLAQKLVCLKDIEGGKFDVVCASVERDRKSVV